MKAIRGWAASLGLACTLLSATGMAGQTSGDLNSARTTQEMSLRQTVSLGAPVERSKPTSQASHATMLRASSSEPDGGDDPEPDPEKTIFFGLGSMQISNAARATLQNIAARLRLNRRDAVTLVGRTDDLGSKEYCIAISSKRIDAVQAELQKLGAYPSQVRKRPRGFEAAEMTNCITDACRRKRRRVEILFDE